MRILIFSHSLACGGSERVVSNLANIWSAKGHCVTIVTIDSKSLDAFKLNPSIRRIELNAAHKSEHIFHTISRTLVRIYSLRKILRQSRPDAAWGVQVTASVLLCLAALRIRSIKVFASERSYPANQRIGWLRNLTRRLTYPTAYRVILLTHESLIWLKNTIPRARGIVIPNPSVYPLPDAGRGIPPHEIVRPNQKILLAVGRLNASKGFDILIKAFAEVAPANPAWTLVIVGDGELRSTLLKLARELGLGDCVHLIGRAGNMKDWYECSEIYVMSSLIEGFPNSLLEAMAHGCASTSFDCDTGPRDLIVHQKNGLLVNPVGDYKALAITINDLMKDRALRSALGEQAKHVRRCYSIEQISQSWENLFLQERS